MLGCRDPMQYSSLIDLIVNSDPTSDWLLDDELGIYTLKDDVHVNLVRQESDSTDRFEEPWTQVFPDKHAFVIDYHLMYSGSFVESFMLVAVDGGRVKIPLPQQSGPPGSLHIDNPDYHVGKVIHGRLGHDYDDYLRRAGITHP